MKVKPKLICISLILLLSMAIFLGCGSANTATQSSNVSNSKSIGISGGADKKDAAARAIAAGRQGERSPPRQRSFHQPGT